MSREKGLEDVRSRLEDGEIESSSQHKKRKKASPERTKSSDKRDSLPRYDVRHLLDRRRASRPRRRRSSSRRPRRGQSPSPRSARRSRSGDKSRDEEEEEKKRGRSRQRSKRTSTKENDAKRSPRRRSSRDGLSRSDGRRGSSSRTAQNKEVFASGDKIMVSVNFDKRKRADEEGRKRRRRRRRGAQREEDSDEDQAHRSKKRSKKGDLNNEYGERERCLLDNGRTTTKEAMHILQKNKPAAVIDLMASPVYMENEKELVDLDEETIKDCNIVRRGPCTPPPVGNSDNDELLREEEHIELDVTPATPLLMHSPATSTKSETAVVEKPVVEQDVSPPSSSTSPSKTVQTSEADLLHKLKSTIEEKEKEENNDVHGIHEQEINNDTTSPLTEPDSKSKEATLESTAMEDLEGHNNDVDDDDTYDPCVPTDSPTQETNETVKSEQPEEEESFDQFFDKLLASNNATATTTTSTSIITTKTASVSSKLVPSEKPSVNERMREMKNNNSSVAVPMDLESPYCSPEGSDLSDIFEPPDSTQKRSLNSSSKRNKAINGSKRTVRNNGAKAKVRVKGETKRVDGQSLKIVDEVPTSAVEMAVKEKFLVKVQRQERTVEEIKMLLKPLYSKRKISKQSYKEIMKKCVPKVCHSKGGEINTSKIQKLVEGYVKKYQHLERKQKRLLGQT